MPPLGPPGVGRDRGVDEMKALLEEQIPAIKSIRSVTEQPGISLGVIYQGDVVFTHNMGMKNVETKEEPNSDTIYCIASLTKAFMTASLDLLVQEEKLSWDSTIESILPNFKHVKLPDVYSHLTVRDICSHRSGLLSLNEITQGMHGKILLQKKDVVEICSALPIKHDLRSKFLYNDALYELAGCIVERVSGYSNWGDFQNERIFKPLGMTRTSAFRSDHEKDENIATPYMVLTDETQTRIEPTELSSDSMNGGSGGVRSSVNDLLKWCKCILQSFDCSSGSEKVGGIVRRNSPIFERATIANPGSAADGDYCLGWCQHHTPAKLGLISPNRTLKSPVVGTESPSLMLYGHQGDVPGYTCNLYIIPESNAAIVVLSNGTGLSDATDWISQHLIQVMHGLQPMVDFEGAASIARSKYLSHYHDDFKIPLEKNRIHDTLSPSFNDFEGTYTMDRLDLVTLQVAHVAHRKSLLMTINKQSEQAWQLCHYHYDVFCHLPESYDAYLREGLVITQWSSYLISFNRGPDGVVQGLSLNLDGVDVHFTRHLQETVGVVKTS